MTALTKTVMSLAEFRALPQSSQPTELIDGELIVSPSPIDEHQQIIGSGYTLLLRLTGRGKVRIAPLDVYLDEHVVQPDIFWVSPENERCRLDTDGYWYGPPDLCIEVISATSANRDHRRKYQLYEHHGVREYWIIDPTLRTIYVYSLQGSRFEEIGVFDSHADFHSPQLACEVSVASLFESRLDAPTPGFSSPYSHAG